MEQATDWWARGFGLAGIGIAVASLAWNIIAHVRTGGRAKVEMTFGIVGSEPEVTESVAVRVRNVGGRAITVGNCGFLLPDKHQMYVFFRQPPGWDNPRFPHTVEAGQRADWLVPIEWVRDTLHREGIDRVKLRPFADLQTGKRVVGKGHKVTAAAT